MVFMKRFRPEVFTIFAKIIVTNIIALMLPLPGSAQCNGINIIIISKE